MLQKENKATYARAATFSVYLIGYIAQYTLLY